MTWDGLETHSGFSSLEWSGDQPGEMRAMLLTWCIRTPSESYQVPYHIHTACVTKFREIEGWKA